MWGWLYYQQHLSSSLYLQARPPLLFFIVYYICVYIMVTIAGKKKQLLQLGTVCVDMDTVIGDILIWLLTFELPNCQLKTVTKIAISLQCSQIVMELL